MTDDTLARDAILLALTGWDPEVWIDELGKAAPRRPDGLSRMERRDPSIPLRKWLEAYGLLAGRSCPISKPFFSLGGRGWITSLLIQSADVPISRGGVCET